MSWSKLDGQRHLYSVEETRSYYSIGGLVHFAREYRRRTHLDLKIYLQAFAFIVQFNSSGFHEVLVCKRSTRELVRKFRGFGPSAKDTQIEALLWTRKSYALWRNQGGGIVMELLSPPIDAP
jgi:hypothetical protein